MSEVKFSKEHEWIILNGDIATIGITKHATEQLGDIVFTELPDKGSNVEAASEIGKMVAERAKKAGVSKVIFDRGSYMYHGRIKALAESAREAGLNF